MTPECRKAIATLVEVCPELRDALQKAHNALAVRHDAANDDDATIKDYHDARQLEIEAWRDVGELVGELLCDSVVSIDTRATRRAVSTARAKRRYVADFERVHGGDAIEKTAKLAAEIQSELAKPQLRAVK